MDAARWETLLLFAHGLDDEVGQALGQYLTDPGTAAYVRLARALWGAGRSLRDHLIDRVLHDENPFTLAAAAGRVTPALLAVARHDLQVLGALAHTAVPAPEGIPGLPEPVRTATSDLKAAMAESADWGTLAEALGDHLRIHGAGDDGRYLAFRWEEGRLTGVAHPDPIRLEDLVGNEAARQTVLRNMEQFLQGLPANNLLLYGNRGTGKSSTVKALLHRFGDRGLRLVEVSRLDLAAVGAVMRHLAGRSRRYLLFIDDLSFEDFEAAFKSFKAVLEGSVEQRPGNVLVVATTNRRRLVRERWTDRQDDEVHPGDSMQEIQSLADRFGLSVVFMTPDQEEYLTIVTAMAAQRGVDLPPEELRRQALQWAMWQGAPSGRTARQFMDDLCGRLGIRIAE